jgi:hypothetical protein
VDTSSRDQDGRRVCRHWEKGNCTLGDICGFAHPEWAFKSKVGFVGKPGEQENDVEQVLFLSFFFFV